MRIMLKETKPSGAHFMPCPWNGGPIPDTHYGVADGVELSCGGYGALTVEDNVVTVFTPDTEAWEAWQAANPEPETTQPTEQEDNDAMLVDHEYRLTLLELGVNE